MANERISRRAALKGLGTAGAAAVAGCTTPLNVTSGGDELRYAQVLPPLSLDPVEITEPWSGQVARRIFQSLYRYDHDLGLVPDLAAGPPTVRDGGRTYAVALSKGETFSDNTPVTAADVAYSFEAPRLEDAPTVWQVDMIESVRTPDERTVEFSLAHPYPAFGHTLTRPILPKARRSTRPEVFSEEPVGSGPYQVETFKPSKYAVLTARRDDSAGVERIRFVGNHSGLARTTSLKTGQSDVVERVQPKLWKATKKMPHARVETVPSVHYVYVAFNINEGPMTKPAAREAVDYVFDMDEVVRRFVTPNGRRTYGPLPPQVARAWGMPRSRWRQIPHSKNSRRAKEIFKAEVKGAEETPSGWFPKVAVPKHDLLREKIAETIVHGLKEAGFTRARVEKYHWKEFREKVLTGAVSDYDLFVGTWAGGPDPDTFLYPLLHENNIGLTNGTFYRKEPVMRAIRTARETRDRAVRRKRYKSAIETLLTERVHLPAFTLANSFGVKSRVRGLDPHPRPASNPRLTGDTPVRLK